MAALSITQQGFWYLNLAYLAVILAANLIILLYETDPLRKNTPGSQLLSFHVPFHKRQRWII